MQLTIDKRDGFRVLRVSGELDTFGVQAFREKLGQLRSADRFVVDLGETSFIDSAGLHALFTVGRLANDVGASVVFVVPVESPVRRVVELVRLPDVSPVCDTLDLASLRFSSTKLDGLERPAAG